MASAVSVSNLFKTYPARKGGSAVEALKGVSLEIGEGDFFALLGPNGAGKTTLIGVLTSLLNKTSGEASMFGASVEREPTVAKLSVGLVPQEFNLNIFETTLDIVLTQAGYYGIPRREALKNAEPILRDLGLWDKRFEKAETLSGGMKRRLMIARALVHHPRLLILDEPTAGVDVEMRHSMWEFLRKLNQEGVTIVLTTHYLEEAEALCRNVAVINHGTILIDEPMSSLLQRHGEKKLEEVYLDLIRAAQEAPKNI